VAQKRLPLPSLLALKLPLPLNLGSRAASALVRRGSDNRGADAKTAPRDSFGADNVSAGTEALGGARLDH